MSEHPTSEDLERYVMDLLEERDAAALEAHVAGCAACAAALEREARLEVSLAEVAATRASATTVQKEAAPVASVVSAVVSIGPARRARRSPARYLAPLAAAALLLVVVWVGRARH